MYTSVKKLGGSYVLCNISLFCFNKLDNRIEFVAGGCYCAAYGECLVYRKEGEGMKNWSWVKILLVGFAFYLLFGSAPTNIYDFLGQYIIINSIVLTVWLLNEKREIKEKEKQKDKDAKILDDMLKSL